MFWHHILKIVERAQAAFFQRPGSCEFHVAIRRQEALEQGKGFFLADMDPSCILDLTPGQGEESRLTMKLLEWRSSKAASFFYRSNEALAVARGGLVWHLSGAYLTATRGEISDVTTVL